jgi:hypothetical protein
MQNDDKDDIQPNNEDNTKTKDGVNKIYEETTVQKILHNNYAIDYDLYSNINYLHRREKQKCESVCVLDSSVLFRVIEGTKMSDCSVFLLLGLSNGTVIFYDPLIFNKKYLILTCSRFPVIEMFHDKLNHFLVTKSKQKHLYHVQYWSLPDLLPVYEFYCPKSVTCFARVDQFVMLGFNDGALDLIQVNKNESKQKMKTLPLTDNEIKAILTKLLNFEHKKQVKSIDSSSKNLKIFLSFR